ncbi:MAG: acetyl-CoA carboxylase biotin carboxylase subunit [Deltaproteobacteria bacterium]|nr:acetyl-CoA carboxylase biotin carboxylase subunit [Deltaproteobacteria bacterium]
MFGKVLVANRGEIALRVIRACKELGLKTVAVHSVADADALHVRFADETVCIGPAPSPASYLNIPAIISAAEITGADAVHPGYGFLAENDEFAELCGRCGLRFIGPSPELMRIMGDKVRARRTMADSGVPMLPGSGVVESERDAEAAAEQVGYPLIVKASAGGGGRGMKIVESPAQLLGAWAMARAEAQAGFGNPAVYFERYLERPRHIEIQVMADRHGNAVHLGERECSIQRRHQKLVEEAPSCVFDQAARDRLGGVAVKAIRAVGYDSVGTLEFLMDAAGQCYFMEMNTRIQVEHTVTEEVTGFDLVQEQILCAAGERLSFKQDDVQLQGHAIECRINAEDPRSYAPWPGRITALHLPGGFGVRVDTAIYDGYVVPPHYDSLIAKLVVHAPTRDRAIERLRRALSELVVEGIRTNAELYQRILRFADFRAGRLDTGFLARLEASGA